MYKKQFIALAVAFIIGLIATLTLTAFYIKNTRALTREQTALSAIETRTEPETETLEDATAIVELTTSVTNTRNAVMTTVFWFGFVACYMCAVIALLITLCALLIKAQFRK